MTVTEKVCAFILLPLTERLTLYSSEKAILVYHDQFV